MSVYYSTVRYSTARQGPRTVPVAGPFAFHDDALVATEQARRALPRRYAFLTLAATWGTVRVDNRPTAHFNEQLGYRLDIFGLARPAAPDHSCESCGWTGDRFAAGQHELVRHGGAQTCWPIDHKEDQS